MLNEFRSRLIAHGAERRLFDAVLALAQTQGLLQAGGRQRSDSTHVLSKIRMLGRYELIAETLRHALEVVADVAPDWLRARLTGLGGTLPAAQRRLCLAQGRCPAQGMDYPDRG